MQTYFMISAKHKEEGGWSGGKECLMKPKRRGGGDENHQAGEGSGGITLCEGFLFAVFFIEFYQGVNSVFGLSYLWCSRRGEVKGQGSWVATLPHAEG